jgi:hypothetical protein|tara:strand:- start:259 stop:390 length:132 start_codon:yes stop_codon:yes gene_type:complete
MKKSKAKIKKVIKGLKGAVKAHTGQHKMLSSVLKGNGKNKKRS